MTILPRGCRRGIGAAAVVIAAVGSGIAISSPTPAAARVFVGFGFGFPIGFPGYYYPPYPYPYYPPPPPPYYYPPPPGYPPAASYQPSAGYPPAAGYGPSGSSAAPPITYTPRPGWTNAQGQHCREYKSNQSAGRNATKDTEPPVEMPTASGGSSIDCPHYEPSGADGIKRSSHDGSFVGRLTYDLSLAVARAYLPPDDGRYRRVLIQQRKL